MVFKGHVFFLLILVISIVDIFSLSIEQADKGHNHHHHHIQWYQSRRVTGVCFKEILYPVSESLFESLLILAKEEKTNIKPLLDSFQLNSEQFSEKLLPAFNLYPVEAQRTFLAWATQTAISDAKLQAISNSIKAHLGFSTYEIPKNVHAMSGGRAGYVTGGLYTADMVMEAIKLCRPKFIPNRVLDWGGSTGRAIAMMKAAYPQIEAYLADPIRNSIKWASENLKSLHINTYASPISPPTNYSAETFDLVYGVSIWSHYNPPTAGLAWIREMHRILHKSGLLVITTHGWAAIYSKATKIIAKKKKINYQETANKIYLSLNSIGYFYLPFFENNVDWDKDTQNKDWGMSWVSPIWLERELHGIFKVLLILNGRNDCLQDVIVLQKI